jgi:hypothetical protein
MQLGQCSWSTPSCVAHHGTPSGGGPDRGGGTPRPGRFGEAQSKSRITRSAASDAARRLSANCGAFHRAGHYVKSVGGKYFWRIRNKPTLKRAHLICPVAGYDRFEGLSNEQEIACHRPVVDIGKIKPH